MTTGTVLNNGAGPQGPNNAPSSGTDNNMPGSGILSGIIQGTQTYNAATLEFDFIPYADTVRFKYVFGSEEYPDYVGSSFDDAFGFFITGPGIAGTLNMATLPNGNATSITDDFAESNNPSARSLKISVSPKKINLNSATTKAITKNAIQMIFNAISNCLWY